MKFQIDFNREKDDKTLELIGTIKKSFFNGEFDIYYHEIEIENYMELEELLYKVDNLKKDLYSAVISFDPPTIYLDNKV